MVNSATSITLPTLALLALWAAPTPPARAGDATVLPAAAKGGTPREITTFLRRRAGCNRLSSDDGDDPGRVAETVKSRFWMKCSTLDDDERRLRARYADTPSVINALDQGGDFDNSDN